MSNIILFEKRLHPKPKNDLRTEVPKVDVLLEARLDLHNEIENETLPASTGQDVPYQKKNGVDITM